MRLLFIPGVVEAFFDGGIAIPIFGMPPAFAFALGFILKAWRYFLPLPLASHKTGGELHVIGLSIMQAVGPALVIQAMFEVQQKRLGVAKGALTGFLPVDLHVARAWLSCAVKHCPLKPELAQCCPYKAPTRFLSSTALDFSPNEATTPAPVPESMTVLVGTPLRMTHCMMQSH